MTLTNHNGVNVVYPAAGATRYEYDHFSGSQITVSIGDVVIDEAVAINFSVSQSKTPIFGYANQYYTFIADGHVLIQGSLAIGFKEAGYLFWPIKRFLNKSSNSEWTSPRFGTTKDGQIVNSYSPSDGPDVFTQAAKAAEKKRVMQANVEQMVKNSSSNPTNAKDGNWNRFYRELGAMSDQEFEDYAETFEDAIWYGSDTANALTRDRLFSSNLQRGIEIDDETIYSHRRADQYPPIDIWIVYGDMSRQTANHTVKKLMDLSFVGQSQAIEVSGEPTLEIYNFIARNIA